MEILSNILNAKEQRQAIRRQFAQQEFATISLNFNIPGYPKSDESIKEVFLLVKKELENYLIASRIKVIEQEIKIQHDEAGDICFFPFWIENGDLESIKENLEAFESSHELGRLLDIDLFNTDQKPISSGKKKSCFLCEKPAIVCMREGNHSFEELNTFIYKKIQNYIESVHKETVCKRLAALATQSILIEVSLPGKPGLVCPDSQGSHTDMNYLTFMNSTSAISPYFQEITILGYEWDGIRDKQILQKLRSVGLEMENAMFNVTNGINTQKGIIFLMGFSLFAAAYVIKTKKTFQVDSFRNVLSLLNRGIVKEELENGWNKNFSNGEKCFNEFGKEFAGGIRQEIEQGLPTIFNVSLPFILQLFPDKLDINKQSDFQQKLLYVLVKIISVNNDTNILHRANIETLQELKANAGKALAFSEYAYLREYCQRKNISPGGSADLLAVTLFIYQVLNDKVFMQHV